MPGNRDTVHSMVPILHPILQFQLQQETIGSVGQTCNCEFVLYLQCLWDNPLTKKE